MDCMWLMILLFVFYYVYFNMILLFDFLISNNILQICFNNLFFAYYQHVVFAQDG